MKRDAEFTGFSPGLSAREADHLQVLEGNPLSAEEKAMFEMFDRESWSNEKRREYIRKRTLSRTALHAAE